jgi:8-oxo-dGTP pyrophosphatase MutT (NUDIX family)
MINLDGFHLVKKEGITAIIINKKRVLVMKRIALPFLLDSGIWTFIAGRRERGEPYLRTAYREVFEESGIPKKELVLHRRTRIVKLDIRGKGKYYNPLYVFYSKTKEVRKNIENSEYRWATLSEIRNEKKYTNIFADKGLVERLIKSAIGNERTAVKKKTY